MTPQEAELFIRSFSHEMKNPLTTIKGYAQLLKVKGKDPSFVDKAQSIIVGEVERMETSFSCFYSLFAVKNAALDDVPVPDILAAVASSSSPAVRIENECGASAKVHSNFELAVQSLGLLLRLRWADYPGADPVLRAVPSEAGSTFLLTFGRPLFSALDETSFAVPFASARYFATGAELFSSHYLLSKIGGTLSLTAERDGFRVVFA